MSDGQPYVDEPVYCKPLPVSELDRHMAFIFNRKLPEPILVAYQKVNLRWMKLDGKGGLVPR
jgi:hypothetical protein